MIDFIKRIQCEEKLKTNEYNILLALATDHLTKAELAMQIDVSEETVARMLTKLWKLGLIYSKNIYGINVVYCINDESINREIDKYKEVLKSCELIINRYLKLFEQTKSFTCGDEYLTEVLGAVEHRFSELLGKKMSLCDLDKFVNNILEFDTVNLIANNVSELITVEDNYGWAYEFDGTTSINIVFDFIDKEFKNSYNNENNNLRSWSNCEDKVIWIKDVYLA